MIIYIGLMTLYGVCSFFNISKEAKNLRRNVFSGIMLIPMFFIVAARDLSIGNDTEVYYNGFMSIARADSLSDAFMNSRYESGYVILNYIISHMGMGYYMFQIIVTAFIFISLYVFIVRNSENIAFSCFIFVSMRMLFGAMSIMRMWIAIAILLYAINAIKAQKIYRFLFFVFCAMLFHKTAIVFIILYPISKFSNQRAIKSLLIVGACIISFGGTAFFSFFTSITGQYEGYLDSVYFNNPNMIGVILSLFIDIAFLIIFIVYRKQFLMDAMDNNSKISLSHISYLATYVIVAIDIIGLQNTIMNRISAYFTVIYLYAIPHLTESLHDRQDAKVLRLIIICCLMIQDYIVMLLRPEWNGVTPYKLFFY